MQACFVKASLGDFYSKIHSLVSLNRQSKSKTPSCFLNSREQTTHSEKPELNRSFSHYLYPVVNTNLRLVRLKNTNMWFATY